jgi:hypothetical protein
MSTPEEPREEPPRREELPQAAPAARQRGIRLTDLVLIAGQRGKGKTELARMIAEGQQPVRLIVIDPKGEHSFTETRGGKQTTVAPARTPLQLAQAMHGAVVHYIPASFDRDALEEAFEIIWETPGPYILWVDEGSEVSSPNWCPAGLRLCATQGRVPEKQVILVTQRLAEIHPVFRSQSDHVFLMVPAPVMLDLKAIAGNVRREASWLERELAELHHAHGDYSHLWYCRDTDEMRRCAPIPLPARPRPAPCDEDPGDVDSDACEASAGDSGPSSRSV